MSTNSNGKTDTEVRVPLAVKTKQQAKANAAKAGLTLREYNRRAIEIAVKNSK